MHQGYLSSSLGKVDCIQRHGQSAQALPERCLDRQPLLEWYPKMSCPRYQVSLEEVVRLDAVENQGVAQLFQGGDLVIHSLQQHRLVHCRNSPINKKPDRLDRPGCQLTRVVELCHQIKRGAVELLEHGDQIGFDAHRIGCRHPAAEADDQVGPFVPECFDHLFECFV